MSEFSEHKKFYAHPLLVCWLDGAAAFGLWQKVSERRIARLCAWCSRS